MHFKLLLALTLSLLCSTVLSLPLPGGVNSIPAVSQVKSIVQAACGDVKGAEATQQEFSRTCPGVAQITETVHIIGRNHEEAKKVRKEYCDSYEAMVDGIPVAGHIKGLAHYATGNPKKGEACMVGASKSLATIAGGLFGGPAGAVGAGAAVDLIATGIKSAVKREFAPIGIVEAVDGIAKGKEHRAGAIFDVVAGVMMDAAGGVSGKSGATKMKAVAKSPDVVQTKAIKNNLPKKIDGEIVPKKRVTKEIVQAAKELRDLDIAVDAKHHGVLSKITDTEGGTHSGLSGKPRKGIYDAQIANERLVIRLDDPSGWSPVQTEAIAKIKKENKRRSKDAGADALNAYIESQNSALPTADKRTWSPAMKRQFENECHPPSGKWDGQKSTTEFGQTWEQRDTRNSQSQCAEGQALNKIPDGAQVKEAIAVQYKDGIVKTVQTCDNCATYQMPKVYTDHIPQLPVPQQYATFWNSVKAMDIAKVAGPLLIPHEDEKSHREKTAKYREEIEARARARNKYVDVAAALLAPHEDEKEKKKETETETEKETDTDTETEKETDTKTETHQILERVKAIAETVKNVKNADVKRLCEAKLMKGLEDMEEILDEMEEAREDTRKRLAKWEEEMIQRCRDG